MKTALISGASKGIGKQLKPLLELSGFRVVTMGFETNSLVDIRVDLRSLADVRQAVDDFFTQEIGIDLLICNAGTGRPPVHLPDNDWPDYFIETNVVTAKNLVLASLNHLVPSNSCVIGISSIAAAKHLPNSPKGYGESKQLLNETFRELATKYAKRRTRFNIISLGNVLFEGSRWSEISNENPTLVERLLEEEVPLGSFITPREIAAAIVYLASDDALNITGANLFLDGGQSL